ncbi:MAG: hypothetical protein QOE73_1118 [Verrucomicrobiota bacterium]
MSTMESSIHIAPPTPDLPRRVDGTGAELKRGAFLNTIAMLSSNFGAIFTLLIARLLGPVSLGIYSVAWATTNLFSKFGVWGLDDAIITFIARAQAVGDFARSRALFRLAVVLAVAQSTCVAVISIIAIWRFGEHLHLKPEMVSAFTVTVCALPGVALYRISTSVSRGMKVMKHDIYSRGITEPAITILAFLIALIAGFKVFGPELAAIVGTAASGLVALTLALRLFRHGPEEVGAVSLRAEARGLLGYAFPIGADQLLNAFIWRLDVIMLGWFVGRAPGVTLTTLGIYSAASGLANALRRVSQPFSPIFAPIVAEMTATGKQERAAATYARLMQWMLWVLLPLVAVMILAGDMILIAFGPAFRQGSIWLAIAAIACAVNAFINLSETAIMVQRPTLNLLNSSITCVAGSSATLWLIWRFGVIGAAFGLLLTYMVQGVLRTGTLRFIFRWPNQWRNSLPPVIAAIIALVPALFCRVLLDGIPGQLASAAAFLVIFGVGWLYHSRSSKDTAHL